MPNIDLEKLREKMKHGDYQKVAHKTKYTREYVRLVIKGEYENSEIVEAAIKLVYERENMDKYINQKIQAL